MADSARRLETIELEIPDAVYRQLLSFGREEILKDEDAVLSWAVSKILQEYIQEDSRGEE